MMKLNKRSIEKRRKKIKELEEEIKLLEAEDNWPMHGDKFFVIGDDGIIRNFRYDNDNPLHLKYKETDRCFGTKEHASKWSQISKVYQLLWKYADGGIWCIRMRMNDPNDDFYITTTEDGWITGIPTFSTNEKASNVIDIIGKDEIKKIFKT